MSRTPARKRASPATHGPTPRSHYTYRSYTDTSDIGTVPEPRTPAHPQVRPPTRISSGPCTLRSPRSAIPMTPSVAPIRRVRMRRRAPLLPPPFPPRHRAAARDRAGSCRVAPAIQASWRLAGSWAGPAGPVSGRSGDRMSGPVRRATTHGPRSERASGKRASKSRKFDVPCLTPVHSDTF